MRSDKMLKSANVQVRDIYIEYLPFTSSPSIGPSISLKGKKLKNLDFGKKDQTEEDKS